ncbi:MAG TPA: hypothetical protein PK668_18750 [Myxococcota bacterium]|nr:hypothetical protein [Myxococcota bacterium]HRY96592.1 hypothetical protein [Myxococcota bacterium]HSA20861.1 hypothetical protein [Myxococcota bacterium]
MGNALIVAVVPEESLAPSHLVEGPAWPGQPPPRFLSELYDPRSWDQLLADREHLLALHPEACYLVPVTWEAIWEPPAEYLEIPTYQPPSSSKGAYTLFTQLVGLSLERFLNARLGLLRRMLRTGAWVLREVGVKVTKMEG